MLILCIITKFKDRSINTVRIKEIVFGCIMLTLSFSGSAQNHFTNVPELNLPASLAAWQQQRHALRDTLITLLGNLPPRPDVPAVKILSRENKGAYTVEKFEFENGAGTTVPGYFLLPNNGQAKHPAIYYCHWHGGNYDLGKQEIFTTHHTPKCLRRR
jgi:hypothetical protein